MAGLAVIGRNKLFPAGNLVVIRQAGATLEGIFRICGCCEVFRIVLPFIDMHLLIANHRIRRFTGETCATIEGLREGRDLSVVVKETGRNGLQCLTTVEGLFKVSYFRIMNKQSFGDGD